MCPSLIVVNKTRIPRAPRDQTTKQSVQAGIRTFPTGFEALMKTEDINGFSNLTVEPATIDEIVVFTSKKGDDYE